ncbi:hypothetical protein H4075_09580 [Lacibacter sediminis]|uniref:Lipoprotein n=1 Tax=Lacibacter sediminis TaxID=2760713 RepID=A0A7G5XMP2_9BACT|nr:hypothetical protein H4075_09580 [Lacibacter sediminis]
MYAHLRTYRRGLFYILLLLSFNNCTQSDSTPVTAQQRSIQHKALPPSTFDTILYRKKLLQLANSDKTGRWPVASAIPAEGAVLPFNRVVAFYGNFYSKHMGILGEFSTGIMLEKLKLQVEEWEQADTSMPVIAAIHYIAVTAQSNAGDGYYRARMPEKEISKAIALGDSVKGLVFLDIQPGLSTLQQELPRLEKYLQLPNVHLGIDAEYSMKTGRPPGSSIGSFDADDINYASEWLQTLVKKNKLPSKILVVHRFTAPMLTNYTQITTRPEVQIVINMDGFGNVALKKSTYHHFIFKQPVQFAGFKVFYKNDAVNGNPVMQPNEILRLTPVPVYIQYQ